MLIASCRRRLTSRISRTVRSRLQPLRTPGPRRAERFAEYKAKVEAEYRREAVDRGCDRVREVEQNVTTPAMLRIEAEDPGRRLAGFDHRLKGKERLTEKVTTSLEEQPDLTIGDAKISIPTCNSFQPCGGSCTNCEWIG